MSREATTPSDRLYHVSMMLNEVVALKRAGDTRAYLSLDEPEQLIIRGLLEAEVAKLRYRKSFEINTRTN